jgi:small subunit ribosomal protein S18
VRTTRPLPTTTSRSRRFMARERTHQRKRPGRPACQIKRRYCFCCKDKIAEIDYKNVNQLRRYISEKGKIRSRRITGACRRHQVQVAQAVKRAREMALLPYVAEGADDRERGGGRGRRDREER